MTKTFIFILKNIIISVYIFISKMLSMIEQNIEELNTKIIELEKIKKYEDNYNIETNEYNIYYIDKYIEDKELRIKKFTEEILYQNSLKEKQFNDNLLQNLIANFRCRCYSELIHYKNNNKKYPILYYVFKLLKCLFSSTKQIANNYDDIILRLNKLEKENNELKNRISNLKNNNN